MDIVSSMLDLMRRLPPTKIDENVDALVQICPDYAEDLSGNVDQPLKLRVDKATGKEYLACVYNQDGESYRCAARTFSFPASPLIARLDRPGRTNMTLRQKTAPYLLRNYGNLRSQQTRRSIRIARCKFFHSFLVAGTFMHRPSIYPNSRQLNVLGTSKAVYPPSFCGISRMEVSQALCF